jgi:putative transposase
VPTIQRTWAPRGKTPIILVANNWTKISAISAISVSPDKRRAGLYIRFHDQNIRHPEVLRFLKMLRRHLKKGFVLLWDRGRIHKAKAVKAFLWKYRRSIHSYFFPGYSPELNPDEYIWSYCKRAAANSVPKDNDHLRHILGTPVRRLKTSRDLLLACVRASGLSWK